MKSVAVFCASAPGSEPLYVEAARSLGRLLAQQGITVIYGGAKVGLMGAVADAALEAGGKVTGVIPHFLRTKEIAHEGLTGLLLVDSMHERKMKMHELSEGVIALPGGFGTMEELFEILTWAQLGLHTKPVALLNIDGFYDSLLELLRTMINKGFLKEVYRRMLLADTDAMKLLHQMKAYAAPEVPRWIPEDKT